MQNSRRHLPGILFLLLLTLHGHFIMAQDSVSKPKMEWFGYLGGEYRHYPQTPLYEGQKNAYFSAVVKPQFSWRDANGKNQLTIVGFARADQHDNKRSHADIRDFYWHFNSGNWEMNAGIKTISWGKTESNHLVDIINQHDLLEGRNLEHKLGQPLVHAAHTSSTGTFEIYLATMARELHFPGEKGRLRPGFTIDYNNTEFERKNGKYLPDAALRFARSIHDFDFAVSHFYGTARQPVFKQTEADVFVPRYEEINQTGIEFQWLKDRFVLKAEGIFQTTKRRNAEAATIGIEYNTFFKKGGELKWLLEYTYDSRDKEQISQMNDDLFFGINFNLNDKQSTHFMVASIADLRNGTTILRTEAERRFGEFWKIHLTSNHILHTAAEDFYYFIRKDSFLEIGLLYFFQN